MFVLKKRPVFRGKGLVFERTGVEVGAGAVNAEGREAGFDVLVKGNAEITSGRIRKRMLGARAPEGTESPVEGDFCFGEQGGGKKNCSFKGGRMEDERVKVDEVKPFGGKNPIPGG